MQIYYRMRAGQSLNREEFHTLMILKNEMGFAGFGTIAFVLLNIANFCMKNHLTADLQITAEIHLDAGFFTRGLKYSRTVSSTEKRTSHHSNKRVSKKEEDSKKRKKEM